MKPLLHYARKYKSVWHYWDGTEISIQREKQLKNRKHKFKGGYDVVDLKQDRRKTNL